MAPLPFPALWDGLPQGGEYTNAIEQSQIPCLGAAHNGTGADTENPVLVCNRTDTQWETELISLLPRLDPSPIPSCCEEKLPNLQTKHFLCSLQAIYSLSYQSGEQQYISFLRSQYKLEGIYRLGSVPDRVVAFLYCTNLAPCVSALLMD